MRNIFSRAALLTTCVVLLLVAAGAQVAQGSESTGQSDLRSALAENMKTAKAILTEKYHEAAIKFDEMLGDYVSKALHEDALEKIRAPMLAKEKKSQHTHDEIREDVMVVESSESEEKSPKESL